MKEKLRRLVQSEDSKNPLTDTELATQLGIRREEVTIIRNQLGILDSRERRKAGLLKQIETFLKQEPDIGMVDLTRLVNQTGYAVARCTVSKYAEKVRLQEQPVMKPDGPASIPAEQPEAPEGDVFAKLVGYNRSLKSLVQLAKAAVLYPPHGLHTIITGPTGVGKSELAECMYEFAVASGTFIKDSPFIVFNAADYAENQQLLLSQLFGHVRGAFTGADTDKAGLVEKANGGVLFIDEIHRLPHEGQEILFQLIDKGKVRRLGETKLSLPIRVMLISATSEPLDSYLLTTFKRRIPMVIEIPDLNSRPLGERYHIINNFFVSEARRIGAPILVKADVYKALMLYKCHGNLGQLRSDIQVACARGLLNRLTMSRESVWIGISEVPEYVMQGLIDIRNYRSKVDTYVKGDVEISPDSNINQLRPNDSLYHFPEGIYRYMEERYLTLLAEGLAVEAINRIVGGEVEKKIQQYIKNMKTDSGDLDVRELTSVVGKQIVSLTEEIIAIASEKMGVLDGNLLFSLAIHLKATISRLKEGKKIQNNNLAEIARNYSRELAVARDIARYLEQTYGILLPEEELGFMAIYLNSGYRNELYALPKVGVLLLAHGRVASAVAEVVNKLLGVMKHIRALDMSLEKTPQETLNEAIRLVKEMDEGKGVILLADMGSLAYFGEFITKETGIETRTLTRLDTVLAIEVARRTNLPDLGLDDVLSSIRNELPYNLEPEIPAGELSDSKPVILAICVTGSGTAKLIKDRLTEALPESGMDFTIETRGIVEFPRIDLEIDRIKQRRKIIAIVGTINPHSKGIPFFNAREIVTAAGLKTFKEFISSHKYRGPGELTAGSAVGELLAEENIHIKLPYTNKQEVITFLAKHLIKSKAVEAEYLTDVFQRETVFPTELDGGVAIPHADEAHVLRSAISIATLAEPIQWVNKQVNIVVMLAVDKHCFTALSSILGCVIKEDFKKIARLDTAKAIKEAIVHACT